jgi:hypothetical protein
MIWGDDVPRTEENFSSEYVKKYEISVFTRRPYDGGSKHLWNIGQFHETTHPRKQSFS